MKETLKKIIDKLWAPVLGAALGIGAAAIHSHYFGETPEELLERIHRQTITQQVEQLLVENQQTLHVTDSLLHDLTPRINAFTADRFEYEKNETDDLGRFRYRGSDPGENPLRSYLRSVVDDYGRTQLIATYCGPRSFCVTRLRLRAGDGTQVTTESIAPNDGANYLYEITGTHYQVVTFMHAEENIAAGMTQNEAAQSYMNTDCGALAYIANYADDPKLKCFLLDDKGHETPLAVTPDELKQLSATYELSLLLSESMRLQQENRAAALMLENLQTREVEE